MKVNEAVKFAADLLRPFSDEAENEARIYLSHLADCEPSRLRFSSAEVEEGELVSFAEKRRQGIPLQYIIGKWWFYKSEFLVGEGVLVPRQDTEILVETGLELIKNTSNPRVADLCSGSGCIAVSVALDRPDAEVFALEKYPEAFSYLEKNIKHNKADNVKGVLADVTLPQEGEFDLILCNPPYIPLSDRDILSAEVLNEPHTALFGGEDGLDFYRIITRIWKNNLKTGGRLAFEVGIKEAEAVMEILRREGFVEVGANYDLIGIQRVVFGTLVNV